MVDNTDGQSASHLFTRDWARTYTVKHGAKRDRERQLYAALRQADSGIHLRLKLAHVLRQVVADHGRE